MTRRSFVLAAQASLPDLRELAPDLVVPPLVAGEPAAGCRVRVLTPGAPELYHVIYLPTDWQPRRRYPVIVEYAGNGNYRNAYGDVSLGVPEGSNLGYGLSGGQGYLWLCLPYVDPVARRNQTIWWGDAEATNEYGQDVLRQVCQRYGGDPQRVLLSGFSRGAIACSYLGLRDDPTADQWRAFFAYSHFDGVRRWPHPDSDPESALRRLRRLRGRPVFVCHEGSAEATRAFLTAARVEGRFTYEPILLRNHNDAWVLRDLPERRRARAWLREVMG